MEEAKSALARTRQVRTDDIHTNDLLEREIEGIRESAEYERKIRAGWLACFNPRRKILYRTLLGGLSQDSSFHDYSTPLVGMSLQCLQQLTGANYFFYYGATIFQSVGIDDSYVTQIILGSVNFGCTFGGLYVMEKVRKPVRYHISEMPATKAPQFGRRKPLIIGGLWQSAWLFVFAAAGTAGDPESDKTIGKRERFMIYLQVFRISPLATVMIISACLFILGFATTWAP